MNCVACKKLNIDEFYAILISSDGDFVCDAECRKKYYDDMERFCTIIAPNPKLFERWLTDDT